MILCHPLDYPFYNAMFNDNIDIMKISRLWNECSRKYIMGGKKNITKWQLHPLVEQYTKKLRELK